MGVYSLYYCSSLNSHVVGEETVCLLLNNRHVFPVPTARSPQHVLATQNEQSQVLLGQVRHYLQQLREGETGMSHTRIKERTLKTPLAN